MKNFRKSIIAFSLMSSCGFFIAITNFQAVIAYAGDGFSSTDKDPNNAKEFTLLNYDDKEIKLSDYVGKIVVLEWFNYDCPFVKAYYNTGTTKRLVEKYAKKDVVWLAVNSTYYATAQADKDFAEKNKINIPILLDADGKVGKLYRSKTTPHLFVIDKKGKIAYQGACDNAPLGKKPEKAEYINYVEKAIDELLADKDVTIAYTKAYGCSVKYRSDFEQKDIK